MIKGKRGSFFFGIMIGIFTFVMGVLFIPYITDSITAFRTDMNCASVAISSGSMLTCLLVDVATPYFIWFFVSLALAYIAGSRL